jgi:isopenicillin-N N-acyltransferase-like protein
MMRLTHRVAISVLLLAGAVAAEPFRYPTGRTRGGELAYLNGLPVLQVSGLPRQIGAAVGALALAPAKKMASYPEDLVKHYHIGPLWSLLVLSGRMMVEGFPADFHDELEALASSSGVERDRIVAGNTLFDLKKFLACSALLVEGARSDTGAPLLGRNLDYPSLGYAHEYSLVTIYHPAGARHAFASVGFPGLIGCLSGINDAGLSLAILEVFQVKASKRWFNASGTPYALCYRRLLEECSTIDEAKALLEKMKRTTTTNLAIADRHGVAVFEVTPDRVVMRKPHKGACIATNHFCSDELRPYLPVNHFTTFDRYRRLECDCRGCEKFAPGNLHRSLHAVADGEETLQTMIFEPAALRLHLAIGTCPASAGPLRTLELGPLFRKR